MIRKLLQRILACIFSLRIFDKGKQMAYTKKIRRKKKDVPRKPKTSSLQRRLGGRKAEAYSRVTALHEYV
jgi:hypothetical protein